MIPYVFLE